MKIETKTKSHPRVTYLDTNKFYWAINAVYGSNLESVNLSKRLRTNNQQKRIDWPKPRSNKNECEFKKCGCDLLLCAQLLKFLNCNIAQVNILVMYKNGSIVKN